VSETSPDQGVQRFVLRAPTPLRALAVSAGTEVAGAVLLVAWAALDLPVVVAVLGAVLLAFGGALLVAAILAIGRLAQTVELDEAGVTFRRGQRTRRLPWAAVQQVTLNGARLTLRTDPAEGEPVKVLNPGGGAEATFLALLAALRERLDADRGYRPLE
jgi:hypothetical protein